MSLKRKSLAAAALFLLAATYNASAESYCEQGKPLRLADVSWESGAFLTELLTKIFGDGYGCKIEKVSGNSLIMSHALITGDIDIYPEQWVGRTEVMNKARAEGTVRAAGHPYLDAREGWYVPDYVVNGDPERGIEPLAPELKSVEQLADPKIRALFSDPEEPSKGRFLNCPTGWSCERLNTAKLEGYGLDEYYTNFLPGSGAALDAEVASSYLRKQPVLFYYWNPTALMGTYKLLQLEEPAYSDECWDGLTSSDTKTQACAFPLGEVVYDVNVKFADQAPDIIEILSKATIPLETINEALAYMAKEKAEPADAATWFLKNYAHLWTNWVSTEAAEKINQGLN